MRCWIGIFCLGWDGVPTGFTAVRVCGFRARGDGLVEKAETLIIDSSDQIGRTCQTRLDGHTILWQANVYKYAGVLLLNGVQ